MAAVQVSRGGGWTSELPVRTWTDLPKGGHDCCNARPLEES
jgi:hypothetical protein